MPATPAITDEDSETSAERVVTVRFVVEENYRGWRLDRYLCAKIRRLSEPKPRPSSGAASSRTGR